MNKVNSAFDWLPVSSVACRLGSDRYPIAYMNFDYPSESFHESYYGTEKCFTQYTEDRVTKSFIGKNSLRDTIMILLYLILIFKMSILQHDQLV